MPGLELIRLAVSTRNWLTELQNVEAAGGSRRATQMRIRKNVEHLNPAEQQRLLDAFARLKTLNDPNKNYKHFASIHGHSCPHGCELFLPWHRAYIFEFENALRQFDSDVTLPYWDWTQTPRIPTLFAAPPPNPLLYDRYTDQERQTMPNLHPLPTKTDTDNLAQIPDFAHFGGSSDDTPWMGCLEIIHGWPHLWVGDTMADIGFAACDPLFWAHHANVDRIWAKWQVVHPGSNPSNLHEPLAGLDMPWIVSDVINTNGRKLGYEYATSIVDIELQGSKITGSRQSVNFRLPDTFEVAELRLEDLSAHTRSPLQLQLSINTQSPPIRIPLFGVHSHSMQEDAPAGVKPCFEPSMHHNPCGRINVRRRIPSALLQRDSEASLSLTVVSQRQLANPEIDVGRAYIVLL
jgi:tyrosinase